MIISEFTHSAGLKMLRLSSASGASVELSLKGAHITSYKNQRGEELLYLSSKADLSGKKAIRGGIPLIFPQFGPRALPKTEALPSHGFARNLVWSILDSGANDDGAPFVVLSLEDSQDTLAQWPHRFLLLYRVTLGGEGLRKELTVENRGERNFPYQVAFHTYFKVGSVERISIHGLGKRTFLDNTKELAASFDERETIVVREFVDRVYLSVPPELKITESGKKDIVIQSVDLPDAILWNPGIEQAAKFTDIGEGEYRTFVCVECGRVGEPAILAPGASAHFAQTIHSS